MELTRTLLLIDLMPILYRGYFVFLNKPRRTASGVNTSSLTLFANTVEQMRRVFKPSHMAIAMESRTPTFRHQLYPPYKGQREKMPEDIAASIDQAQELAAAWGIKTLQADGYEADDILGTLAERGARDGFEVIVASPDKDLGQLAGPHTRIYRPGETSPLGAEEICAQWGIAFPAQLIDYLALAGDMADNIPGVPGVGPKTACRLIQTYGSVENLLAHAEEIPRKAGELIRAHREALSLSKRLTAIERNVPLACTWDELRLPNLDLEALAPVLRRYELNMVAHRLGIATSAAQVQFFGNEEVKSSEGARPAGYRTLAESPHDYRLVSTEAARTALATELQTAPKVALQTILAGSRPHQDRVVGVSFAVAGSRAWYVPLPEDEMACREVLGPFQALLSSPQVVKVGYLLKATGAALLQHGYTLAGPQHDTLLAHYLLDATDRHELDHLANRFLNYAPIPLSQLIGTEKPIKLAQLAPEALCDYAAESADLIFRLDEVLRKQLAEFQLLSLLETCEEPLSSILLAMECEGVRLDLAALRRFRNELEGEIIRVEMEIRTFTGAGINLASPKQVGEFLFNDLAIDPTVKRTPRGQFPTNEELLLKLRDRHPVIDLILDWRACVKLKNTYVDRLPEHISPVDGRIHTTFNQAFTDTGRLSSSEPNLQNVPVRSDRGQRIRAAFVARGPGWQLLSADYSQVELRLMAAMSGDATLIEAFLRGEDIHAQTAAAVFGIPVAEVTPRQRAYCKMVNFGIIYGISSFGLGSRLRIPRKEAQTLIETYFAHYPAVKAYMEKSIVEARTRGYAQTLFGRRRNIPEISSRNATTRAAAERIAINMPIQGSAADIIKFAMVRIDRALREQQLKTRLILQIHDELLFDVPDEEVEMVKPIIRSAMENVVSLAVPLSVSIGTAQDWLSAH